MSLARIIHLPALVGALAITASLAVTAPANAQSSPELRRASDGYRDAAREFDRYVNRAGYFSRFDERLADRLEEMAREFRSAARNPRDVERLIYHWNDLTATHIRVEETLIRGCGRPDPTLLHLWGEVTRSYAYVASEMQCFTGGHVSNRFPSEWDRVPVQPLPAPSRFQHDDFYYDAIPYRHQDDCQFRSGRPDWHVSPGHANFPQQHGGNASFSGHGRQVNPRAEVGAVIAATLLNRLLD